MFAYCAERQYNCVGHNVGAFSNNYFFMYYSKRINPYIAAQLCIRMDESEWRNHTLTLGFFTIWATKSASAINLSPTKIVPFISQMPRRTGFINSILRIKVSPGTTLFLNLQLSIFKK